jgi:hypothetical protein
MSPSLLLENLCQWIEVLVTGGLGNESAESQVNNLLTNFCMGFENSKES